MTLDILMLFAILSKTVPDPQAVVPRTEHHQIMRTPRKQSIARSSVGHAVPLPRTRPALAANLPPAEPAVTKRLFLLEPDVTLPPDTWNIKYGQLPPVWFQIFGFVG